jgi:predicted ATPase/DNA-binding CsgD family transcriptional regulator
VAHDIPADVPARVREARRRLGLSQQRLASLLGVTRLSIVRWEQGRTTPAPLAWQQFLRVEAGSFGPNSIGIAHSQRPTAQPPALHRSALSASAPAPVPASLVPAPLTSFVGREREVAEVTRLLGMSRLLTLVGVGGGGKTRLAIEAARRMASDFTDGVVFVDLAPLADPALVAPTVASALRIPDGFGRPLSVAVIEAIADRRLLLILDNCEHLIGACATLAVSLLQGCPLLHVLATSREPLAADGETVWRVPTLALPGEQGPGRVTGLVPSLAPPDAVALFVERARSRAADFELTDENAPVVARICRRLDGLPLAIELAAARTGTMALGDIEARLDDRFRLLRAGSRLAPARQQTLQAALDWSYDLLGGAERTVFDQLAAFAGGFDLTAVEAVCAVDGVVAIVEQLVECSMVVFQDAGGFSRYSLLETLRAYAVQRLTRHADAGEVRARHALHFREYARRLGAEPDKSSAWIDRVQRDLDNLRAALAWWQHARDAGSMLELMGSLSVFWRMRALYGEGRRWYEAALALGDRLSPSARARGLYHAGALAREANDLDGARTLLEESVAVAREAGLRDSLATTLPVLAYVDHELSDWPAMEALCREALHLCGDPVDDAGRERLGVSMHNLGIACAFQEKYDEARALFTDVLQIAREIRSAQLEALAYTLLGALAVTDGDESEARRLFSTAHEQWRAQSFINGTAIIQAWLGELDRRAGNRSDALEQLSEAIATHQQIGVRLEVARDLIFVVLLAADVLPAQAATLTGVVDTLAGPTPILAPPVVNAEYQETVAAVRRALGAATFDRAYAAGLRGPTGDTIDAALVALRTALIAAAAPLAGGWKQRSGRAGPPSGAALSARERDVLHLVADGRSNKEISRDLTLSVRTVERHLENIYAKLGARGRADAISWALRNLRHLDRPLPG